jgi:hypothetical protein
VVTYSVVQSFISGEPIQLSYCCQCCLCTGGVGGRCMPASGTARGIG